jgi:hypothetical protein
MPESALKSAVTRDADNHLFTSMECPSRFAAIWLRRWLALLAANMPMTSAHYTRGGIEWSHRLARLVAAIRSLNVGSAWLDGDRSPR